MSFLENNLPGVYKLIKLIRPESAEEAAPDAVPDIDDALFGPELDTADPEPVQETEEPEEEEETEEPEEEEETAEIADPLDDTLRDLFDEGPIVDPTMEGLLARVEEVDVRSLAEELRILARSIGATGEPRMDG